MKRRILIVVVFLLGGAVVNVAVAWGVFYGIAFVGFPRYTSAEIEEAEATDLLTRHSDVPFLHVWGGVDRNVGIWAEYVVGYDKRDGLPQVVVFLTESGWPVKTMRGRVLHENDQSVSYWIMETSHSYIPFCPIWSGFAVNTLCYTAVLWLLIPGPFALRRVIRVRRGLCPKCVYPMGESQVCTECGKTLPSRHIIV